MRVISRQCARSASVSPAAVNTGTNAVYPSSGAVRSAARFGSSVSSWYVGEFNGCTCTPSATAPVIRSIQGFTAARSTGGSGTSIGPGDHICGSSDRS